MIILKKVNQTFTYTKPYEYYKIKPNMTNTPMIKSMTNKTIRITNNNFSNVMLSVPILLGFIIS